MKYFVLQDTREQKAWSFGEYEDCLGTKVIGLKTGDYTIEGLEDKICIERKASASEIAQNLGKKKATFERELERMQPFPHKYIICEFSLEDLLIFPEGSDIPKYLLKEVKITGKYMLKTLLEFQVKYGFNLMFCGDEHNAFILVTSLLKRLWNECKD